MCLKINGLVLIAFIKNCRARNVSEQFIINRLSNQSCEKLFRQLRSMASTNQTIINFSIKEMSEKLKRVQMKWQIIYKYKYTICQVMIQLKIVCLQPKIQRIKNYLVLELETR